MENLASLAIIWVDRALRVIGAGALVVVAFFLCWWWF